MIGEFDSSGSSRRSVALRLCPSSPRVHFEAASKSWNPRMRVTYSRSQDPHRNVQLTFFQADHGFPPYRFAVLVSLSPAFDSACGLSKWHIVHVRRWGSYILQDAAATCAWSKEYLRTPSSALRVYFSLSAIKHSHATLCHTSSITSPWLQKDLLHQLL